MLWEALPDELDTRAIPIAFAFLRRGELPDKAEGTIVADNLLGYAQRQLGLADQRVGYATEPTDEDFLAAVSALEANVAPASVKAISVNWLTLAKLFLKILQGLLCLFLAVGVASAGDIGSPVPKLRSAYCVCGPTCLCADCPRDCVVPVSQPIFVPQTAQPGVSYAPFVHRWTNPVSQPVFQSLPVATQMYSGGSSACANGQCGVPQRSGVFRRR
jgi:hypothetical protein